jgi:hypothetical protein
VFGLIDGANAAEVFTAVFTALIGVGVFVAIFQLGEERRTRRGEMAKEVSRRWASEQLIGARKLVDHFKNREDLQEAVRVARREQNDDHYQFTLYLNFFEELGVICQHTRGGVKVVDTVLGSNVVKSWDLWKPIIEDVWGHQPTACENFRWLARRVERYREWKELNRWIWLPLRGEEPN